VLWPKIGHVRSTCQAGQPCNLVGQPSLVAPLPFPHWILLLLTYFDTWWKQFFVNATGLGRPAPLWVGWARALCHVVPLCHIVCEHPWFWTWLRYVWILVYIVLFPHPMFLNGRLTKLMKLVSKKDLSSISWMKYMYVGSKYMYFMTTNTAHT
jgi:hypothetical protein